MTQISVQQPAQQNMVRNLKFFGGLKTVKASMDANYARPGRYLLKVRGLKTITSNKGEDQLIWELTCLHVFPETASFSPALKNYKVPTAGRAPPHIVGEELAWSIQAKHQSAKGNLKQSLVNILYDGDEARFDSEATEEDIVSLCVDPCPLTNMVVEYVANLISTKVGGEFTKITLRREVPAEEVLATVPADIIAKHFPPHYFENLRAAQGVGAAASA